MANLITPTDGMTITESVKLNAGIYVVPNGITITADNVTLNGEGVTLIGSDQTNVGINASGQQNITIKGISLSGYHHGVAISECKNVTVENVTVRDTAEIEGIDTFLNLWQPAEEAYGGAILFSNVQGGTIQRCDLQHQMNGVMLYNCSRVTVEHCNASFNSGWGVYLNASSDNVIQDNHLDFCNRLFRRPENGSIRVEADAAGIVLVEGSSRNHLLRNSCLCGGDGIFIAGYRHPNIIKPCSENVIEDNDCRLSPNNAIESTFSQGNIFRRNDCSRSNYGFWMGYSWENVLEDNHIEFNRFVGIAVEHGHNFTIRKNTIQRNGEGVRLWLRGVKGDELLQYWEGYEATYNFTLEDNTIESNRIGFHAYTPEAMPDQTCYGFHLRKNTFHDNQIGASFARVKQCTLEGNTFARHVEGAVRLIHQPDVLMNENVYNGNASDLLEQ